MPLGPSTGGCVQQSLCREPGVSEACRNEFTLIPGDPADSRGDPAEILFWVSWWDERLRPGIFRDFGGITS